MSRFTPSWFVVFTVSWLLSIWFMRWLSVNLYSYQWGDYPIVLLSFILDMYQSTYIMLHTFHISHTTSCRYYHMLSIVRIWFGLALFVFDLALWLWYRDVMLGFLSIYIFRILYINFGFMDWLAVLGFYLLALWRCSPPKVVDFFLQVVFFLVVGWWCDRTLVA